MRKKILAANWKMNFTHSEAESFLESFVSEIRDFNDVDVVIIPPFTAIPALVTASERIQTIRVGAQNMHWEKKRRIYRRNQRDDASGTLCPLCHFRA